MVDRKTLAYIGAGVAGFGTFLPIVSVPILGDINYVGGGDRDGVFVMIAAAVSAALAYYGRFRWMFASAGIGLAITLVDLVHFMNLRSNLGSLAGADNPFAAGLTTALVQSVQIQWGWVVIIAGLVTLLYAAWRDPRGPSVSE